MGEEKEVDSAVLSDEEREMERIRDRKMREMEEKVKARKEGGDKGGGIIDHPLTITDGTFVEAVKKISSASCGLLGALVWSLQNDCTSARGNGEGIRR